MPDEKVDVKQQKKAKKRKLPTILVIVFLVLFLMGPIGTLIEDIQVVIPTPASTEPVTLPLDAQTLLETALCRLAMAGSGR